MRRRKGGKKHQTKKKTTTKGGGGEDLVVGPDGGGGDQRDGMGMSSRKSSRGWSRWGLCIDNDGSPRARDQSALWIVAVVFESLVDVRGDMRMSNNVVICYIFGKMLVMMWLGGC